MNVDLFTRPTLCASYGPVSVCLSVCVITSRYCSEMAERIELVNRRAFLRRILHCVNLGTSK